METCATHGLRYDPSQHDGCVLCRRLAQPSAASGAPAATSTAGVVRGVVIALVALGVASLVWLFVANGPASVADSECAHACARQMEPCFEGCRSLGDGGACQSRCIQPAHDCLAACGELQALKPGELRFAYAYGEAPPAWSALRASVERAASSAGGCELRRGTYSARFDVLPDGALGHVAVGSPYEPASFCLQNQYRAVKGLPASAAGYSFAVHGIPPPALPQNAAPIAAKRAPEPQKPVDYLEVVNKMTAKQAEAAAKAEVAARTVMIDRGPNMPPVPGVAVAGPAGAAPKIVPRESLKLVKKSCGNVTNHQNECFAMIEPIKASMAELPVNDRVAASSALRAYEMNRGGLGFDCVWFQPPKFPESEFRRRDAEDRGWSYPKIALIIASAPEARAFASASRLEPFDVQVRNAPWPATYRAILSYNSIAWGGPLKPAQKSPEYRPYGLCLDFANDKPAQVYIGVAIWMDGPSAHDDKDDAEAFNQEVLSALGVEGSWSRAVR